MYSKCNFLNCYTCCLYEMWTCILRMKFIPFVDILKHFPGNCIKHCSNLIFWQKINIIIGKFKLHYCEHDVLNEQYIFFK